MNKKERMEYYQNYINEVLENGNLNHFIISQIDSINEMMLHHFPFEEVDDELYYWDMEDENIDVNNMITESICKMLVNYNNGLRGK